MATKEDLRIAAATREVRAAVENILRRNGYAGPVEVLSAEIHAAYDGRHWKPAPDTAGYCPNHPSIRKPCPLCRE